MAADLNRPNIGYDALRATGNYWLMFTLGNYNIIYADVGMYRRYYAQSTIDRMIVYGYWLSYDDVVAWVNSTMPPPQVEPPIIILPPVEPPIVEPPIIILPPTEPPIYIDGPYPMVTPQAVISPVTNQLMIVGILGLGAVALYYFSKGKKR
jgi:hypothetical protein